MDDVTKGIYEQNKQRKLDIANKESSLKASEYKENGFSSIKKNVDNLTTLLMNKTILIKMDIGIIENSKSRLFLFSSLTSLEIVVGKEN